MWETLNADQANIEAKFQPLSDQFQILEKHDVPVPDDIRLMHHNIPNEWTNFQQILIDSDAMLKKYKVKENKLKIKTLLRSRYFGN